MTDVTVSSTDTSAVRNASTSTITGSWPGRSRISTTCSASAACRKALAVASAVFVRSSTGRRSCLAGLDLVRVVRVALGDVAEPHAQAVVLVLPHVAQLVRDQ